MKTFFDIIVEVSNEPWAGQEQEPNSIDDVEKSTIQAIQRANTFIWNLDDFPFRVAKDTMTTEAGASSYPAPLGKIINVKVKGAQDYLAYIADADFLPETPNAQPSRFWVEMSNTGNKLNLYPTPDAVYSLQVRYDTLCSARDMNSMPKIQLEKDGDTLNIPPEYEDLYLRCLLAKSVYNILQDETDESWRPYETAFKEAYKNLINATTGIKMETRIII